MNEANFFLTNHHPVFDLMSPQSLLPKHYCIKFIKEICSEILFQSLPEDPFLKMILLHTHSAAFVFFYMVMV